jgi:7-keto-8-aminopelargonate synthetase-like enzyme
LAHQDVFSPDFIRVQVFAHELVLGSSRDAIRRSEMDAQQLYQNTGQALSKLCSDCSSAGKQNHIVPLLLGVATRALEQSDLLLVKLYVLKRSALLIASQFVPFIGVGV